MKRPDRDDYYWYLPKSGGYDDWQPVKVTGRWIEFIATVDPVDIDELDGTFVRMGRPIPYMGTIGPKGLTPPGPNEPNFM